MLPALRQLGRDDKRNLDYADRQYETAWAGAAADFAQDSYTDVNQRAGYFQYVYSSAPATVMHTINAGSKYPFTARDATGAFLAGSDTFRMHLPPNPPAALFWAVTAYNVTDGTMPETEQLLPSINGFYDLPKNDDGSIDIWSGPSKPEGVADPAFIQTVPSREFIAALRLYGARTEFYGQTWKPGDIVKVE